ncbi:MAG: sulfotransferase [Crocinitomicaceae bacterium]|nr:sulfotransferase [Crocinitomicaceae bacterium]MCF8410784.1 sulfotransferase [Crocinitomicaceae bacterium]MCF8444581.1 sulfotransferase [Crocinitomicaceae bacterium]
MKQVESELNKYPPIHFIIGPGRSGTTLLMMLLNHTQGVIATPEVKHVLFLKSRVKFSSKKLDTIQPIHDFFSTIKKSSSNPLNQFDLNQLVSELCDIRIENYANFAKQVHLSLHKKTALETDLIIDKNNLYTFYVKELLALYPDAKFCVSIRDYRGFVASNMKSQHQFKAKKSVAYFAEVWNCYIKKIQLFQNELGDKLSILRYEDLVVQPEMEMKKLANFFSFQYDETCFQFHEQIKETVNNYKQTSNADPRIVKKIEDLTRPIHSGSINSWKNILSPNEIIQIESISGNLGKSFGYTKTLQISPWNRLIILAMTFPIRFRVKLFFGLRSLKLHHYLNVVKRSIHNKEKGYSS